MADIHFMYNHTEEMFQLCNVFTRKNFLIKNLPFLNCLKIFTNVFVNQTHLELAIETLWIWIL